MKKKLLKKLLFTIVLSTGLVSFAQQDFNFDGDSDSGFTVADGGNPMIDGTGDVLTMWNTVDNRAIELNMPATDAGSYNTVTITMVSNSTTATGVRVRIAGDNGTVNGMTSGGLAPDPANPFPRDIVLGGPTTTPLNNATVYKLQFRDNDNSDGARLIVAGSATDTNIVIDSVVLSAETLSSENAKVFQNTSIIGERGFISINNAPTDSKLSIFSVTGQAVSNSNLSAGLYVVKISTDKALLTKKIVVK